MNSFCSRAGIEIESIGFFPLFRIGTTFFEYSRSLYQSVRNYLCNRKVTFTEFLKVNSSNGAKSSTLSEWQGSRCLKQLSAKGA